MGRHLARRDGQRSRRVRAVLSVGLVLGLGYWATTAYWTDQATVTGGSFTAGSMDLQFDAGAAAGQGTDYAKASLTWTGLAPSEQKAFNLTVRNVGDPPFTYTATVTRAATPAWSYVGTPLTVRLYSGTAVADTTYPQQDSCSGAALGPAQAVDATSKTLLTTAQEVAAGGNQPICIVVGLDSAADSANQAKTGAVSLRFTATQRQP